METKSKAAEKEARFEFGKNWSRFLSVLNEERIEEAVKSLKDMLEVTDLKGKSFLDIGSGSGLFSLAAKRLGARVHSFDYDKHSVACAAELKRRFFPDDKNWNVEQGSALDGNYIRSLGKFDIVYSWGVLHHTGNMQLALENAHRAVADNGMLFISIYNDQGGASRRWKKVKYLYNILPSWLRFLILYPAAIRLQGPSTLYSILSGKAFRARTPYAKNRGMSRRHDLVDWVGGYPFEVAKPEEIFYFYKQRGFALLKLKTCGGGLGCNEFVFKKADNRA